MNQKIAESYARDPTMYGDTYCATCKLHRPVGEHGEFHWCDNNIEIQAPSRQPKVGT